jgi:hypothetical protein
MQEKEPERELFCPACGMETVIISADAIMYEPNPKHVDYVIGFCYGPGQDQSVSVSWCYPPEEWKPLARWFGETTELLDKLFKPTSPYTK